MGFVINLQINFNFYPISGLHGSRIQLWVELRFDQGRNIINKDMVFYQLSKLDQTVWILSSQLRRIKNEIKRSGL